MPPILHTLNLPVQALDRATRFYEAWGLLLSPRSKPGKASFFDLDHGLTLALYPQAQVAQALGVRLETMVNATILTQQVASEAEVRPLLEAALNAGARLVREAEAQPWGGVSALFTDPEGNPWEICWNPRLMPLR